MLRVAFRLAPEGALVSSFLRMSASVSNLYIVFFLAGIWIAATAAAEEAPPAAPEVVQGIESQELAWEPSAESEGKGFELFTWKQTGLDFRHRWEPPEKYAHELNTERAGGGCAIGDYDGDGLADVFLTQPFLGNRLYRNLGEFYFEDVTERSGLEAELELWGTGTAFVDIDNDGDLDLSVCGYHCPNRFYLNQGDGTFVEHAGVMGLDYKGASIALTFSDYDCDGDLDAYLITNRIETFDKGDPHPSIEGRARMLEGRLVPPDKDREWVGFLRRPDRRFVQVRAGQRDRLFRNDEGKFKDVSDAAGIEGYDMGLSATWWDYNRDGLPDLYVANDFFGDDRLYRNNGDGTFKNVATEALPHTPWFSMGTDSADVNNDGWPDLLATDMAGSTPYRTKMGMGDMPRDQWFLEATTPPQYMRNALYINTGTDRFLEAAQMTGLDRTDWTWTAKFADLDCDGLVDLFVSNGMTRDWMNNDLRSRANAQVAAQSNSAGDALTTEQAFDLAVQSQVLREANFLFLNRGDLRFEDRSSDWGVDRPSASFGSAVADLDNDGDLDLVTNNFDEEVSVYQNHGATGHRIKVRLVGHKSNRYGIGARIDVETASGSQMRELAVARGFMSSDEPLVQIGLGDEEEITTMKVSWPSGHVQEFHDLAVDQLYTISEPETAPPERVLSAKPTPMFVASELVEAHHREKPFDDFAKEPLLPYKLSQLGPGVALGDVDGDGDEDLFVGGGVGFGGELHLRGKSRFDRQEDANDLFGEGGEPFRSDNKCEDMGVIFFDADSDGDNDLYVVSGGVECEPDDVMLRDRLYLNEGDGTFVKSEASSLPNLRDSGSTVVAADFDRDGDLDLFVGSRVVPGEYPTSTSSRLLRNEGGKFKDATKKLAPALLDPQLVTSAIWSDVDDDGWIDLMVTCEWGPVRLYRNQEGKLVDDTQGAGLEERRGWWNGIVAGDVDNDGDRDFVVTNFGLNTKYHPTTEHPALVYYGKFGYSSNFQIVEAVHTAQGEYTVRGKVCSQNAMPLLAESFPTFDQFANANLVDIYSAERLDKALRLEANCFESGLLVNDGNGKFEFRPLPRIAQISPAFGVQMVDFDGDGNLDLALAQNFFAPQRLTGRMDGGVGQLLLGDGNGEFRPIQPAESGFIVPDDAKSLVCPDLDQDGWPDLLVGLNRGPVRAFVNRIPRENRLLNIHLQGLPGNLTAVGAKVIVKLSEEKTRTLEAYAGGGYLSQTTSALRIGLGPEEQVEKIEVRWPDGTTTSEEFAADQLDITIKQPAPAD